MLRLVLVAAILAGTYGGVPRMLRPVDHPLVVPGTGRVIGGENTTIENVPYIVTMLVSGSFYCGGSIIKADVVLTAAHCLEKVYPSIVSIRAGSTYKSSGGQVIGLNDFVNHPKYNTSNWLNYDVGVMLLSSSIALGESTKIIPMSAQGESVPDGTMARVSGWGVANAENYYSPENLQTLVLSAVNQEICSAIYDTFNYTISHDMLCAEYIGQGGKSACTGDSGGPLVSDDDSKLIGVVSFGRACGNPIYPGVYARVAAFRDWVDTFLN